MNQQEPTVHKENFQMERIAFFSDAVFAIAITLLIIEIKVPETDKEITDAYLGRYLLDILPKFIGFFISFFVIGLYWLSHHRLFRYINRFHTKLLWANMFFLLPIIIMPFSTAFFSEFTNPNLKIPIIVYTSNIVFTGLMSYRLWRLISNPKYRMSLIVDNMPVRNYNMARALGVPAIFIVAMTVILLVGWPGYFVLYCAPLVTRGIRKYFVKKYPVQIDDHLK